MPACSPHRQLRRPKSRSSRIELNRGGHDVRSPAVRPAGGFRNNGSCAVIDKDRQRGMLFGLAVGDALGASVEFAPPGTFAAVTDFRAGGPHGLAPGEWTDDTSMALALADSIADVGWDLNDQAERYVAWWRGGTYSVNGRVFDIGRPTSAALLRFQQTGDARTSGDSAASASGNGSIMRLAP